MKTAAKKYFSSDICIIGSGIAGLVIADSLKEAGIKINLLESGGVSHDYKLANSLFLNEMKSYEYNGSLYGRYRAFGGSSIKWGGQLLPLHENDFEKKNYIEFSGWPIQQKILLPYLKKCEMLFGLNAEPYDMRLNYKFFGKNYKIKDNKYIKFRYSKWSPYSFRNVSKTLGRRCKKNKNISIFLNTTARKIVLKKNEKSVDYVEAFDESNKICIFRSKIFIIAASTIESNRLLLISKNNSGESICNKSKLLGKCFHDHLSLKAAEIKPYSRKEFLIRWSPKYIGNTLHTLKIEVTKNWQEKTKNLNVMGHFIYEENNKSFMTLLRKIFKRYQEMNFKINKISTNFILNIGTYIKDAFYIALNLLFKNKKVPGIGASIFLYIDCEQSPQPRNNISLSNKKDIFDMTKICFDWFWSDKEINALKGYAKLIESQWDSWNIGELKWITNFNDLNSLKKSIKDTYHPMGGTRMSAKDDNGVVDKNLKAHELNNLYIASCSVFPTGGSSNPTLTLISLCLRLADHLKKSLKNEFWIYIIDNIRILKKMKKNFLRFYSKDIAQLNQITDILTLLILFIATNDFILSGEMIRFLILIAIISFYTFKRTKLTNSFREKSLFFIFKEIILSLIIFTSSFISVSFLFNLSDSLKVKNIFIWIILNIIFLSIKHLSIRKFLRIYRKKGGNKRSILFWGPYKSLKLFSKNIENNPWMGYEINKWFSPVEEDYKFNKYKDFDCNGSFLELDRWLSNNSIDNIFFTDYLSEDDLVNKLINKFGDTSSNITFIPNWFNKNMILSKRILGEQNSLDIWGKEDNLSINIIKNMFDLIFAVLILLFLMPLLIITCIIIKLDSKGSIFFKQERYGLDGKKFKIYKFRSMKVCSEKNNEFVKQAQQNDPRFTGWGKIMRRWSIDELPQLINIIRGEMSFVGPRPHATEHNEHYRKIIFGYMQRHSLKPGITGLAQVEGLRGETVKIDDMEKRIEADLRYLKEWSIGLDLIILFKTFWNIRTKKSY